MAASAQTAPFKITPRDQEVLDRLRLGYTNKEIGEELKISDRTVKQHLRVMFLRAGVGGQRRARIRLLNLLDGTTLDEARLAKLKPRHQEIVKMICDGKTNAEIADKVSASEKWGEQVIKNELRGIFDVVGVFSRSELRCMFTLDRAS